MLKKAPTYSDKEIAALDRANAGWSNLGNSIEMAIGKFNASHGEKMIDDISKLVPEVLKLAEAFVTLADKAMVFEALSKTFEGWTYIFKGLGYVIDSFEKTFMSDGKPKKPENPNAKAPIETGGGLMSVFGGGGLTDEQKAAVAKYKKERGAKGGSVVPGAPSVKPSDTVKPNAPTNINNGTQTNTTTINQNLNFQHEGKDAGKVAADTKRATKDAYRQNPALRQAN